MATFKLDEMKEYFRFLDDLRTSGETNMFGAGSYLREEFGVGREESYQVLKAWMNLDLTMPVADRAALAISQIKPVRA